MCNNVTQPTSTLLRQDRCLSDHTITHLNLSTRTNSYYGIWKVIHFDLDYRDLINTDLDSLEGNCRKASTGTEKVLGHLCSFEGHPVWFRLKGVERWWPMHREGLRGQWLRISYSGCEKANRARTLNQRLIEIEDMSGRLTEGWRRGTWRALERQNRRFLYYIHKYKLSRLWESHELLILCFCSAAVDRVLA